MRALMLGLVVMMGWWMPASAQDRDDVTLYQRGDWVVYGANLRSNRPLCGISITHRPTTRTLHFKWEVNTNHILVVAFRSSWSIPTGTDVPVRLVIDGYAWTATAIGVRTGDGISFTIPINEVDNWERRFRLGNFLRLEFPEGSEVAWTANLVGTNAAMGAFTGCMRFLSERFGGSNRPTQPFSGGPSTPTQPFSPQNVPTSDPPIPTGTPRRT